MVAAAGFNGLMDPVEPGLACGSDTAHMSILGYEPRLMYRGRGAFESMGAGIEMQPGDIAFKCNFATVDPETNIVLSRRADRHFEEEGPVLCAALDGLTVPGYPEHRINVKYATEHRCGLVLRGPGLTDTISGTDPLKDNLPLLKSTPLDDSEESQHTAHIINATSAFIRQLLEKHPINVKRKAQGKSLANVILLRGCGIRLMLPTFESLHGFRSAMVAPTKIIAGLGMCASMDVVTVPGTTGDYRTLFHRKAEAVAKLMLSERYDFVFLHVKAVDDAGHDKNLRLKLGFLEVVDTMIGQLIRLLAPSADSEMYKIVVTGDHSTPVEFGDHSHEPVPFAMADVADVVAVLGGHKEVVNRIKLGPIPNPSTEEGVELNGDFFRKIILAESSTNEFSPLSTTDGVSRFNEIDAAEGLLGRFPGSQIMPLLQRYAGIVQSCTKDKEINV